MTVLSAIEVLHLGDIEKRVSQAGYSAGNTIHPLVVGMCDGADVTLRTSLAIGKSDNPAKKRTIEKGERRDQKRELLSAQGV